MPKLEQQEEFSFKNYFIPLTSIKAIHWIVIIGLIVFCNGLFNGFVGDDQLQIVRNPIIQSLTNITSFFSGGTFFTGSSVLNGFSYKPIFITTYAVIYSLFGPNPFSYHFFQIFLYIVNACFVFWVFQFFFKRSVSFVLSLIFLVHPINSEAAFYIADMQEVLFFFFGITAFYLVAKYKTKKTYQLSSSLLFLSLLSKETGALFLFMSLLFVFIHKRKDFIYFLTTTLIATGVYLALRIRAVGIFSIGDLDSPIHSLSLIGRMINMPAIFYFYIKTFFFPLNLSSSYQWVLTTIDVAHVLFPLLIDVIFLLLLFSTALFIHKTSSKKYLVMYCFFAVWFSIGILFHLQILPLDQTISERWFYFPIVGLLGMIGVVLEASRVDFKNPWIYAGISIIIVLFSFRTIVRSFDWRNSMTLDTHDLRVSKEAYGLENDLSSAYLEEGQYENAKLHAQRSISIHPTVTSFDDLGVADTMIGDYPDAKKTYEQSLHLGNYYVTYENLAGLSIQYGNPQENIAFIKNIALKNYPGDAKLWFFLAILEYKHGNVKNAQYEITKAYTDDHDSQISSVYHAIMTGQKVNTFFRIGE